MKRCCRFDRRDFMQIGGAGLVGMVAARTLPVATAEAQAPAGTENYPIVDIAALSSVGPGDTVDFSYPDEASPALLIRLRQGAEGGVGPNGDLVAFSILCTHKGCPVDYHPDHGLLICPCHWSSFDPAKGGGIVIGQASQPLPRIGLRVEGDRIQATGVDGLIYGRHTNIM